ncbi:hypothetical protein [Enemella sp. A6]|uniref:hypothetical protein n=1 Tax=Enemella sp. A6 TaxID=3440152 RepID=UPI003EBB8CE3
MKYSFRACVVGAMSVALTGLLVACSGPGPEPPPAPPSPGGVDCDSIAAEMTDALLPYAEKDAIEVEIDSSSCRDADPEARNSYAITINETTTTSAEDLVKLIDTVRGFSERDDLAAIAPNGAGLLVQYGHLDLRIKQHLPSMNEALATALAGAANDETSDVTFNVTLEPGQDYRDTPRSRRRLIAQPDAPTRAEELDPRVERAWVTTERIASVVEWPGEMSVKHPNGRKWQLPIPPGSTAPENMAGFGDELHEFASGPSVIGLWLGPQHDRDGLRFSVELNHRTVSHDDQRLTPPEQRRFEALVATMESWGLGEVDTFVGLMYE